MEILRIQGSKLKRFLYLHGQNKENRGKNTFENKLNLGASSYTVGKKGRTIHVRIKGRPL